MHLKSKVVAALVGLVGLPLTAAAAVIGGVVIGADTRIGPNVVVTMNVPAGSTVVAPPPRIVHVRGPSTE